MTTLYCTVLIETAEQAEALPVGAIAIPPGHQEDCSSEDAGPGSPSVRLRCYEPGYTWHSDWDGAHTGEEVVGWTALVPVEAEEEVTVNTADLGLDPETVYQHDDPDLVAAVRAAAKRTRYVTPWEKTQ